MEINAGEGLNETNTGKRKKKEHVGSEGGIMEIGGRLSDGLCCSRRGAINFRLQDKN
jgi:hypothetical protein